jgi:hypothetical protein
MTYLGECEGGDDRECTHKRFEETRERRFLRILIWDFDILSASVE